LLRTQLGWEPDVDLRIEVSLFLGLSQSRHAFASQSKETPILRARRDPQSHRSIQRLHLDRAAQDRCVQVYGNGCAQIVALSLKPGVWGHPDAQIEIPCLAPGRPRTALSGDADARAAACSRGNLGAKATAVLLKDARCTLVRLLQANLDLLLIVSSALGTCLVLESARRASTGRSSPPAKDLAKEIGKGAPLTPKEILQVFRRAILHVDALPSYTRLVALPAAPIKVARPAAGLLVALPL
jgi:hypothetical protein